VWAGDELGMSRTNISRAMAKGLTFRSLGDTARDTLAWFKAQKPERQAKQDLCRSAKQKFWSPCTNKTERRSTNDE